AKLQRLGTGLQIGAVLLEQVFPQAEQLAPVAAQLVANAYTRHEEYQADAHGVEILRRAGYDGQGLIVHTLTWIKQVEGESGGFFATHPATGDRIQAVERMASRGMEVVSLIGGPGRPTLLGSRWLP